jgi:GMP synthase-like glutamine amidotransferase
VAVFLPAGLLLTVCTGYAAYDNHPWSLRLIDLIRAAYAQQIPLVGICYGFQLMSRALGGLVTENPMGSELTVTNVTLTPLGQELIGDGSLVSIPPPSLTDSSH